MLCISQIPVVLLKVHCLLLKLISGVVFTRQGSPTPGPLSGRGLFTTGMREQWVLQSSCLACVCDPAHGLHYYIKLRNAHAYVCASPPLTSPISLSPQPGRQTAKVGDHCPRPPFPSTLLPTCHIFILLNYINGIGQY